MNNTDENIGSKGRASKVVNKPLSSDEFEDLTRAAADPFFFSNFIHVINPVYGKVQFGLYPYQRAVLYSFIRERFNIILKFRQAGLTELISLFCLWYAMFHSNKNINIISIKDTVAKKVLRKIKFMYRNLPDHLQVQIINGRTKDLGTASEIEFANGSLITSIPTTEEAGRSEALSLLVIDEAAIIRWADQIWAAAFPTLSTGGRAILNSCITGDTEIVGKSGNFRVDMIAPKNFGKHNVEALGLEVLSHTGKWRRVLGAVNKGKLKTWEVESDMGQRLKATPAHRVLTTKGWKTLKQVIKKDLYTITFDSGVDNLKVAPLNKPPKKERKEKIKGYPNYLISNHGKVYYRGSGKEKRLMVSSEGYHRVSLWSKQKSRKFKVSILVATHFIGEIPKGHIVDHKDDTRNIDHVNNLQIITRKENAQRAVKHSRGLTLNNNTGKGFPDIMTIGKIWEQHYTGIRRKDIAESLGIHPSYVTRVLNGSRCKGVKISKLVVLRKFKDTIYDICVEKDESYITKTHFINHNTPYGIGNFFHKKWVEACSGGEFTPLRLKWEMHPERGKDNDTTKKFPNWYNEMSASLGPRRTAQEIDGDFLTSGSSVFDLLDIRAIEESLNDYIPLDLTKHRQFDKVLKSVKTSMGDNLQIYKLPENGRRFGIGGDVSTGRSRDYSALSIMDEKGEEYGSYKGKLPPNELAILMAGLGNIYHRAILAPESNDIGLAVTSKLQEMNYSKLYYSTKLVKEKKKRKPKEEKIPGWYTTSKNRPIIIGELEEDIRLNNIIIKDEAFVQEAYTFIYDEKNKAVAMGKGSGPQTDDLLSSDDGYTDDAILAKAITNHVRKIKLRGIIVQPV